MYIKGNIAQEGQWWTAELPSFCIYTQGESEGDALRMLASAVKDLLPEFRFEILWINRERGEVGLKTEDIAQALGFIVRQNRLEGQKTLLDLSNAIGSKYPNTVAAIEKGVNEASISKMEAIAAAMGKRLVVSFEDADAAVGA